MAKTNTRKVTEPIYTHQGAVAAKISPEFQLRRSVMSCLLWEDEFYEDGITISDRIAQLIPLVSPDKVAEMAVEARYKMKLRHMPLYMTRVMAQHPEHRKMVAPVLADIIRRADELAEFLAIYWKNGKCPISAQVKKGLAEAFTKFDEYQLAKYNRDNKITLRDVLFMVHAKPRDQAQEQLWKRLVSDDLKVPDTWEVNLSGGGSKKEVFTRLLQDNKLGSMALLRNLRNMQESGVQKELVYSALEGMNVSRVLPFRFLTAAKHCPQWEDGIEMAFLKATWRMRKLPGKTILIVDLSGSMTGAILSAKSELSRAEVACSLAVLARELCQDISIYATAGNDLKQIHATALVPARRGFALRDAIYSLRGMLGGGGIFLKQCLDHIYPLEKQADRIIVISDEQDCDNTHKPAASNAFGRFNYMINVGNNQNGIAYKPNWTHIDGWSEAVLDYMLAAEELKK